MLMGEGVLGFFFLYSEHYSWGAGEEQLCSQSPLPRVIWTPLLTLCVPQSHENQRCGSQHTWIKVWEGLEHPWDLVGRLALCVPSHSG